MLTDYHCHVLPRIDDGADSTEMSVKMIEIMKEQGVERVAATPHFYAHREKSLESFLEKRQNAFDKLKAAKPAIDDIHLGAEISIEKGISEIKGIEQLAIEGTRLLLLEIPYTGYREWMAEEVYNVTCEHDLIPVIVHLHRYMNILTKSDLDSIMQLRAVFQINNEAFSSFGERRFVKKMMKESGEFIFGSDAHNITDRKPNFDVLKKEFKKNEEVIEASDELFEKYSK